MDIKKSMMIFVMGILLINMASAGFIDEVVDVFVWRDKIDGVLDGLDVEGMKIIEFDVDGNKYNEIKETKDNIEIETEYKRIQNGVKQDIWIRNKQGIAKTTDILMTTEIDYDEIKWNGTTLKLTSTPKIFSSWVDPENNKNLVVPNIFMGIGNKRINYRDVAEKGGYVIAYESAGKYYIDFKIDNLNLKANEEYYIDPTFSNGTDGFHVANIGGNNANGIEGMGATSTNLFLAGRQDNFVYITDLDGNNQTTGFDVGFAGIGFATGIEGNGTDFFILDTSDRWIYHIDSAGNNVSDGFSTAGGNGNTGMTWNGTDFWVTDNGGAGNKAFHYDLTGTLQVGDTITTQGATALSGATYLDNELWIFDNAGDFVYHYTHDGTNQTDGFDMTPIGATNPTAIASDGFSLWIFDNNDKFVYHMEQPAIITTSLQTPADNNVTILGTATFNCSVLSAGQTIDNITFYHNATGTHELNQSVDFSATNPIEASAEFTISNIDISTFDWSCASTSNLNNIDFANANRTITFQNFFENLFIYSNETTEGSLDTFIFNFTTPETLSYVNLIYDSVSYLATSNNSGNEYLATRTISVPLLDVETNKTFYWEVKFDGLDVQNSTDYNQSLTIINSDNCDVGTELILNFTLKYEDNNTWINITDIASDIEVEVDVYPIGSGSAITSFSNSYNNTQNPAQVCLSDALTGSTAYDMDVIVRYETTDHVSEFFYLDKGNLNATKIFDDYTSMNIDLMDLLSADSTSFLFNFYDVDGLPVEDSVVHVFRKYVGEGIFREVERAKQDENGDTIVHLVEEDAIYYFIVTLDGTLVYQSSTYTALCQDTPCQIQLEASGDSAEFSDDWDLMNNGSYTIISTTSDRVVNLTYVSDVPTTMNLTVYKYLSDGSFEGVISSEQTATSGEIALTVPQSAGNVSFFATLEQDDEFILSRWVLPSATTQERFGTTLSLFLGALIILTLSLMAVSEGVGTLVFALIGVAVAGFLGLITTSLSTGVNIVIYLILAGGIIIIKLTRGRK